ncbi:hypothetical protein SCHPADRAFT_106581 [Schizopora paradoxa]|uniref:Uncharacterized protein n=1 Tax=Schizopora paradoxa TaxID=27342 RepID=A0A0H2SAF0_9AGAM|nr:hypothetical protein SCHPADRAFT_106581 [Schizopora paradoxa]
MILVVVAVIWLKRRRRHRSESLAENPPPRYDTTVTPFPPHADEVIHRNGVASVISRLLGKKMRTNPRGGTNNGRTRSSMTSETTLSDDADPPSYSEGQLEGSETVNDERATYILTSTISEEQSSLGSDHKHMGRNGQW